LNKRPSNIAIAYRFIEELKGNSKNPRKHSDRQLNALVKSIKFFGFNIPIAVNAQSEILCGHARIEAAKKLGIKEVPVIRLDHLSESQARAFMLADNKLSEMGSWDQKFLKVHLQELSSVDLNFDIEATGFTVGEIDLIIDSDPKSDRADKAIVPKEGPAISQLGDLWALGEHRILCADARLEKSYEVLLEDKKAAMVISDPPYNVPIKGHVGGKGKIQHREFAMASGEMSDREFVEFLTDVFQNMAKFSQLGSVHSIFIDWHNVHEMLTAGLSVYNKLLNMCVWAKNQAGMGSLYRSQHELCLIFRNGKESHQNNVQLGRFGRYRTNVWRYGGIQSMRHGEEGDLLALHPTVKPIQMIADAILDVTRRRDIVLDPFLGSGTAILACERTHRICYGMELDPLYMDTGILRWQEMTGQDAIHVATGKTFTEMKATIDSSNQACEVTHG